MKGKVVQVGALDPEPKSSTYRVGGYVRSGSEILKCAGGGVWARKAEIEGPSE